MTCFLMRGPLRLGKMLFGNTLLGLSVVAFLLSMSGERVQAGAFALREHSAAGEALSFAGTAAGAAGLGSITFNPATITQFSGFQGSFNLTGIAPYSEHTNRTGTGAGYNIIGAGFGGSSKSGDLGVDAVVPASFLTYQLSDTVWLGMSVAAPYGLATKMDDNYVGRAYGSTTKVNSFEVTPMLGYRWSEKVSFGGGLRVMQFKAKYDSAIPDASPPSQWGIIGLQGDGVGVGFSAGFTLSPFTGTDIGIGYRSEVQQNLKGDFFGAPLAAAAANQPIRMSLTLPQSLMISLRQTVSDRWTLMTSYEWTDWSRLGSPAVTLQSNGQPHPLQPNVPLKYNDNWFVSVGAEYVYTPDWTLRGGVSFESSPLKSTTRNIRLPDNNRLWTSFGAGYKITEAMTLDLAYLHVFPLATKVTIDACNSVYNPLLAVSGLDTLSTRVKTTIDIVALGLTYRFDQPAGKADLPQKR